MDPPTGTVRHIGQIDDSLKEHFEKLKSHASAEMRFCMETVADEKNRINRLKADIERIRDFPHQLRHDDWLPVSDYAFVSGAENSNKFYTAIGMGYFAELTAEETIAFLERKIKVAIDVVQKLEKQYEGAENRQKFAEIFQEDEDFVEIQEPFSVEALKTGRNNEPERSADDFNDIMERLDQLEKEEIDNGEMSDTIPVNQKSIETTNDVEETSQTKLIAPKGVSQKEFDILIKKIEEMNWTSDSESDYEDESEEELDSDDSLPDEAVSSKSETTNEDKVDTNRRRSVAFAPILESGPSLTENNDAPKVTKSILRNKDVKTPVNEAAVRAMDESYEKDKRILPATDAFNGTFVEHNFKFFEPKTVEPVSIIEPQSQSKKPLSRFKQQRINR